MTALDDGGNNRHGATANRDQGRLSGDDVNQPFTGNIGDPPGSPIWEIFVTGSAHTGGFNAVFADGSVHSVNYDIDLYVFNGLGTRNGTSYRETSSTEGVNWR